MIALALLLVLVAGLTSVIVLAVRAAKRSSGAPGGLPAAPVAAPGLPADLTADLSRWVAAGLISSDQAAAISSTEEARAALPPPPVSPAAGPGAPQAERPRRVPVVAEALGYLGGSLGIVGLVLLVSRAWVDMATPGRLALSGAGALVLFAGGALVREQRDPALARLRAFLWLLSSAASGLLAHVVARNGFGLDRPAAVVAMIAGVVTVHGALLWRGQDRPAQQAVTLAALPVLVGALVIDPASAWVAGVLVWMIGAAYVAFGLLRRIPSPVLAEGAGALASTVGAMMVAADRQPIGGPLGVLTAVALVGIVALPRVRTEIPDRVVLLILGGVALLGSVPATVGYFAEGAGLATGAVVWLAGLGLIVLASRQVVRLPVLIECLGCIGMLAGAAVTATQFASAAPIIGLVTAIGMVAAGTMPGRVLMSIVGAIGLLAFVPWTIGRFFPGEGRVPLLILVTGVLLVGVAVLLARTGGRFKREMGSSSASPPRPRSPLPPPPVAHV